MRTQFCVLYQKIQRLHENQVPLLSSNEYQDSIFQRNFTTYITIDYHVRKVLDFGGKPCMDYKDSTRDECVLKAVDKMLLKKFGCTTPFSIDKSKICTDTQIAIQARSMYEDLLYINTTFLHTKCPYSCTHLKSQITSITSFPGEGASRINFPDYIQVYESYYTYYTLSLIAEIGGYVGLFLGISVNQIGILLEKLLLLKQRCE